MSQKILLLSAALLLLFNAPSFGQEKKNSPASPSDISVDQIKKESAKPAPAKDAAKSDTVQDDTPKPVAEGTPVAQPSCNSGCDCNPCNPCQKRCRRGLFSRLRMRMSRCCGNGCSSGCSTGCSSGCGCG